MSERLCARLLTRIEPRQTQGEMSRPNSASSVPSPKQIRHCRSSLLALAIEEGVPGRELGHEPGMLEGRRTSVGCRTREGLAISSWFEPKR